MNIEYACPFELEIVSIGLGTFDTEQEMQSLFQPFVLEGKTHWFKIDNNVLIKTIQDYNDKHRMRL